MAGKTLVKDITFKKIMFKLHYFLIRSTLTPTFSLYSRITGRLLFVRNLACTIYPLHNRNDIYANLEGGESRYTQTKRVCYK